MPSDPTDPTEGWQDYLEPGETLLWTGRPVSDPRIRWGQIGNALFGLPFLVMGLAVCVGVVWGAISGQVDSLVQAGALVLLLGLGVPFTAAGLWMVAGYHLRARLAHKYVRYALSTRRAYIAQRWYGRQLKSYPILPDTRVDLIRDGLDTVVLHTGVERDSDDMLVTIRARFDGLADGRPLYHLIRQIQSGQTAPR